jgi:hypothetical protein
MWIRIHIGHGFIDFEDSDSYPGPGYILCCIQACMQHTWRGLKTMRIHNPTRNIKCQELTIKTYLADEMT